MKAVAYACRILSRKEGYFAVFVSLGRDDYYARVKRGLAENFCLYVKIDGGRGRCSPRHTATFKAVASAACTAIIPAGIAD